jgi:hypothetical protein
MRTQKLNKNSVWHFDNIGLNNSEMAFTSNLMASSRNKSCVTSGYWQELIWCYDWPLVVEHVLIHVSYKIIVQEHHVTYNFFT